MREMKVDRNVGWGIFIVDGREYVWDEDEDGRYVLWGEGGEVLEIVGTRRDEKENVEVFLVT